MSRGAVLLPERRRSITPRSRGSVTSAHVRNRDFGRVSTFFAVVFVTLLAGALRFAELNSLSLRIDEAYTLLFTRLSWSEVLGIKGFYDAHPPLYYSLAKLGNLATSDELGARVIAALFGVLTIPLLFVMTARLLSARAAFVTSFLLAIAPTHIEFSRDGRMYSPVMFAVLLSYAALLEFWRNPRVVWAAIYGCSLLLAFYLDYSAAYAIIPQALLFVGAVVQHPRQRPRLIGAVAVAGLAYAPWLPRLYGTIRTVGTFDELSRREEYLAASWTAIGESVPYVLGLDGRGSDLAGFLNAWDRWPTARPLMLIFVIGVLLIGLGLLLQRPLALCVTCLFTFGVPVTAIVTSLISPGYASRTVQMALIGWCIAVGWLIARCWETRHLPGRVCAIGVMATCVSIAAVTLPATLSSAGRYEWREIAAVLGQHADLEKPIITLSPGGMLTDLMQVYGDDGLQNQRYLTVTDGRRETWFGGDILVGRGHTREQVRDGALVPLLATEDASVDAVWVLSRMGPRVIGKALEGLGYQELIEIPFEGATLWLWARPGAELGAPIENNGEFDRGETWPEGWHPEGNGARFETAPEGGRRLVLASDGQSTISQHMTDALPGLYTVAIDASGRRPAAITASITCMSAEGETLAETTRSAGFAKASGSATLMLAAVCPSLTTDLTVTLGHSGAGDVVIERVSFSLSSAERS